LRLRDLGTPQLTWGDLVRITQNSPPESALVRALIRYNETHQESDDDGGVDDEWEIHDVADIVDILNLPREQPIEPVFG